MTDALMSINEAAAAGVERVRLPNWANKLDHLKIDIVDGEAGPWLHLFSPVNKGIGNKEPMDTISFMHDVDSRQYLKYEGPLPGSNEYKKEEERLFKILSHK